MKAISLKPYDAWAILNAGQLEVGSYLAIPFRARVLLHCSGRCTVKDFGDGSARIFELTGQRLPELLQLQELTDAIVGAATVVGCSQRLSKWHAAPFTVEFADVKPIPQPVDCFNHGRGFVFDLDDEVERAIREIVVPKAAGGSP